MSKGELMKSVIWKLHSQRRINQALLHFPNDVHLCAKEYIKTIIGLLADETEETKELFGLLNKLNSDEGTTESEAKVPEADSEAQE